MKKMFVFAMLISASFLFAGVGSASILPEVNIEWATQTRDCDLAMGDVNSDSVVNVLDILAIVANMSDPENFPFDECQLLAADLNGDMVLNILDIVIIVGNILERYDSFGNTDAFQMNVQFRQAIEEVFGSGTRHFNSGK